MDFTLTEGLLLFCHRDVLRTSNGTSCRKGFDSQKRLMRLITRLFCTAYLSDGSLYTMRDIAINDLRKIERIVFNPTGSSIAVLRAKNPVSIYSFVTGIRSFSN